MLLHNCYITTENQVRKNKMPRAIDFRKISNFTNNDIDNSGKYIGKNNYWKLYSVENMFRVIIHSILSVQISSNWWDTATDESIRNKAKRYKERYSTRPWHTNQGSHDIYYIDLFDLEEIMRVNLHLFDVIIEDADDWIVKIEGVRLPRNLIAHMNFLNNNDSNRIDVLYNDTTNLFKYIQKNSNLSLQIP